MGKAYLVNIDQNNDRYDLANGLPRHVFGRSFHPGWKADHLSVSREHFAIESDNSGGHVLTDLGSMNGTYLNGQKLSSASNTLNHGDKISAGPLRFVYLAPDNTDSTILRKFIMEFSKDTNSRFFLRPKPSSEQSHTFKCPNCLSIIETESEFAGHLGKCPHCGKFLQIPTERIE